MSVHEELLSEIEAFLVARNISPTRFGIDAMRNPSFVFDLRRGTPSPTAKTIDRCREFMRAPSEAAA